MGQKGKFMKATMQVYRIAENFRGKNFCKFCGFVAICESFLCKIWGCGTLGAAKASNPQKFSPR